MSGAEQVSVALTAVQKLARAGDHLQSRHGYRELKADGILFSDLLASLELAVVVEDYPDHPRGPCVLVLQPDARGQSVHAVWGIPKHERRPAVLITAYRPDPQKWSQNLLERKS